MAIKHAKKSPARPAAKPAPAAAPVTATCTCGCGHRHGFWHWVKKLIFILIIFALGALACKYTCCCKKHNGWGGKFDRGQMFVDGCLDISKIKCPDAAQKVLAADLNNDGCITKDEFWAWKKSMKDSGEMMDE